MNEMRSSSGWIEVICGSMFSGKTEELIRRVKRANYAKQKLQVFKPAIDNRYDADKVVSHNKIKIPSIIVDTVADIRQNINFDSQVIAIDEVQFFDDSIIKLCNELADGGKRVIVAGLDQDFKGEPFGPVPKLLAVAEYITKIRAICMKCGNPASRTQRLTTSDEQVIVGANDIYEARCRACHEVME